MECGVHRMKTQTTRRGGLRFICNICSTGFHRWLFMFNPFGINANTDKSELKSLIGFNLNESGGIMNSPPFTDLNFALKSRMGFNLNSPAWNAGCIE